jgi:hypothetical protein
MRKLRLSLAGAAIVVLVGLLDLAAAAAADESPCGWVRIDYDTIERDLASATAEVDDLRARLAAAERRQALLRTRLESRHEDLQRCLDRQLAEDMAKENAAAIEQGKGAGTLDLPEWGLHGLPEGDDVWYVVHCKGTSKETGQDATVPFRVANNDQELRDSIKAHPNGCIPDQYYDRQLVIEVIARNRATGRDEIYATVTGKHQP